MIGFDPQLHYHLFTRKAAHYAWIHPMSKVPKNNLLRPLEAFHGLAYIIGIRSNLHSTNLSWKKVLGQLQTVIDHGRGEGRYAPNNHLQFLGLHIATPQAP